MSSMLKKTGGLSFKPKAGRRPGGRPAAPQPAASTSTTPAPTTESQSQSSTPAPPNPTAPIPESTTKQSIEHAAHLPDKPTPPPPPQQQQQTEQAPATIAPQSPPQTDQQPEAPATQNTEVAEPIAQNPIEPISPNVDTPDPADEQPTPTPDQDDPSTPTSGQSKQPTSTPERDEQPMPSLEKETESSDPSTNTHGAAAPQEKISTQHGLTPPSPGPSGVALAGPPTPPPPSPVPDTIVAVGPPDEPEPESEPTPAPSRPAPKKRQAPKKRKSIVATTDGATEAEESAPKKKRQRKTTAPKQTRPRAEPAEGESGNTTEPKKKRPRKEPIEDPENQTVDHSRMKVGELTKDLGIGKPFRFAGEIEDRAKEARARYRLKKLEKDKRRLGLVPRETNNSASQDTNEEDSQSHGAALAQIGAAAMEAGAGHGVGYDVVDGQIVVHQASLVVNRHNQDMSTLEVVEENDFTRLVNSGSFSKKPTGANSWTDEETEKFYQLLRMFGTDFETISNMFPDKNRRAIKLKFNKEERARPNRINAAMMVRGEKRVSIDLEAYKVHQEQWQTKDKIMAEHAKLVEEHEREIEALRQERAAAGLIDEDPSSSAAKSSKTKKGNDKMKDSTSQGDDGGGQDANDDGEEMELIEEDADELDQDQPQDQDHDQDQNLEQEEYEEEYDYDGDDGDDGDVDDGQDEEM